MVATVRMKELAKVEKLYGYDDREKRDKRDEGKISKKSAVEHMAMVALAEEPFWCAGLA
jgi:hypothetical protein